jgi:hypothetical protein
MTFDLGLLFTNYIDSYYTIATISFVIQLSLVIIYLVDFRSTFSRLIIILLFLVILFTYFLFIFDSVILSNIICSVGDVNNEIGTKVNVSGHVHVSDGEAGKSLASHMGIVGGMGIVGALVGKTVTKAPMPPLAKAGLVIGGSAIGGLLDVGINKFNNVLSGTNSTTSNFSSNGSVSKFLADSQSSVLQDLLFYFETMNLVCLYIVLIIIIQLIFKLYFKDSINLNLSKILGANFNNKVEYYLNKIIHLNKRVSIF